MCRSCRYEPCGRFACNTIHHRSRCMRASAWHRINPSTVTTGNSSSRREHDVIGLSNLCVDIVIPVEQLPSPDPVAKQKLLQQLTADPPSCESWELGGNCNFMIAAARLGMKVGSIGHVGNDIYGQYMDRVLQVGGSWRAYRTCTCASACRTPEAPLQSGNASCASITGVTAACCP